MRPQKRSNNPAFTQAFAKLRNCLIKKWFDRAVTLIDDKGRGVPVRRNCIE
jgi:hypothetical protein